MKKSLLLFILIVFLIITTACSSDSSKSDYGKQNYNSNTENYGYLAGEEGYSDMNSSEESASNSDQNEIGPESSLRMIIHHAHLSVEVKELKKTQTEIERRVKQLNGYIIEANVHREDNDYMSGHLIIRIPEKDFQKFLTDTENNVSKVLERNISGQDVTEQYVDLESRLKSKRVVEERLLTFMKEAKKTEDLLTISSDLAKVQEEIEVVTGKMKYIDNQVAFSTIEISMYEKGIKIPELENKNLDTWEKTKQQLVKSINFVFAAGSALFVFVVGNIPILVILLILGFILFISLRRKKKT